MARFCTYCGMSFTRDEHLQRHISTHNGLKPFKCPDCHMTFARRDLLQRHYQIHGKDYKDTAASPNNSKFSLASAGRTPIACASCSRRKVKCDKKFPCGPCSRRNINCTRRATPRAKLRKMHDGSHRSIADDERSTTNTCSRVGEGRSPSCESSSASSKTTPVRSSKPAPKHKDWSTDQGAPSVAQEQLSPPTSAAIHASFVAMALQTPNVSVCDDPLSVAGYGDFLQARATDFDGDQLSDQMQTPLHLDQWVDLQMADDFCIPPAVSWDAGMSSEDPSISDASAETPANIFVGTSVDSSSIDPDLPGQSSPLPSTAELLANVELGSGHLALSGKTQHSHVNKSCPDIKTKHTARHIEVVPLQESTRDKLVTIFQAIFLQYKEVQKYKPIAQQILGSSDTKYIVLPHTELIELYLQSYANIFEQAYNLSTRDMIHAADMIASPNEHSGGLLLLMMIAHGAMATPFSEAQVLAETLADVCRVAILDALESNMAASASLNVFEAALLYSAQDAWSTKSWNANSTRRGLNLFMEQFRSSGMLHAPSRITNVGLSGMPNEQQWQALMHQETRVRQAYSWVMVDHEISVFNDKMPLLSVSECCAPVPSIDRQSTQSLQSLELRKLFRLFADNSLKAQQFELTVVHLRLLLHPLNSLIFEYRQLLEILDDSQEQESGGNVATETALNDSILAASSRLRRTEIESLLDRWHALAAQHIQTNGECAMMRANILLYHIMSLNMLTNLGERARRTRSEGVDTSTPQLLWLHRRSVGEVKLAITHAIEVLRIVRDTPHSTLPCWWSRAVYKSKLVLSSELNAGDPTFEGNAVDSISHVLHKSELLLSRIQEDTGSV